MMQNQQQKRDKPDTGDSAPFRAALHRPVVEAAEADAAKIDPDPEQLNEIFEVEEAAQIDPEPEQLNEIFDFEEAAQINPEEEQLNNKFPESEQILLRMTLYRFSIYLINKSLKDHQLYLLVNLRDIQRERLSRAFNCTGIQGEVFTHTLPKGLKCGSRNPQD